MTEIKSVYEDKPFIKIDRSKASGKCGWEIKVIGDTIADVDKLRKLDAELNKNFGTDII